MERYRPAAVSGYFYPAHAHELRREISTYLEPWPDKPTLPPGSVLIIPHAGYQYSARIAAAAYKRLKHLNGTIKRVVILAPAHRKSIRGAAISGAKAFTTPFGDVEIDDATRADFLQRGLVNVDDEAHDNEHAIEVHLPFLQTLLNQFSIVPIVVGQPVASQLDTILSEQYGRTETITIISSDLSHFLDEASAKALDGSTVDTISSPTLTRIDDAGACGSHIINRMLPVARYHSAPVELLAQGTSADSGGSKERVVGYASIIIHAV